MEGPISLFLVALTFVIPFALFGVAAHGWGADSRDPMPDDHRR